MLVETILVMLTIFGAITVGAVILCFLAAYVFGMFCNLVAALFADEYKK